MVDFGLLSLFIPTFFIVSITPGMCMTLAMTLGMSVGIKRTLFMMLGELIGVAIVASLAVVGIAAVMLKQPLLFTIMKLLGALYLCWIGLNMWRSKGKMALNPILNDAPSISRKALFYQGISTAIANPKGWAFMVSLLPPFINQAKPLFAQLSLLIGVILCSEFICMMLYASTGRTIAKTLTSKHNVVIMNRVSGSLMILVAIWLALS